MPRPTGSKKDRRAGGKKDEKKDRKKDREARKEELRLNALKELEKKQEEEERLREEEKKQNEYYENIEKIPVAHHGEADVRSRLEMTFADLFDAVSLDIPVEVEPEATIEGEAELPSTVEPTEVKVEKKEIKEKAGQKKKKAAAPVDKSKGKKKTSKKESTKKTKTEIDVDIIPEDTETTEITPIIEKHIPSITDANINAETEADFAIEKIKKTLQNDLEVAKGVEDEILQTFQDAEEQDEEMDQLLIEEYGLQHGIDINNRPSNLNLNNETITEHNLIDIKTAMNAKETKTKNQVRPRSFYAPISSHQRTGSMTRLNRPTETVQSHTSKKISLMTEEERKKKLAYAKAKREQMREVMPQHEVEMNKKILESLESRTKFLKNKRYDTKYSNTLAMQQLPGRETTRNSGNFFIAEPSVVEFEEYAIDCEYYADIQLRNVSQHGRRVQILPPKSIYFSMDQPIFPTKNSVQHRAGLLAPGMAVSVRVWFSPDSLGQFEDELTVFTEDSKLIVPLRAKKLPPKLNLPNILSIPTTLCETKNSSSFTCKNSGSSGRFWLMSVADFDESNTFSPDQGTRQISQEELDVVINNFEGYLEEHDDNDGDLALMMDEFLVQPAAFHLDNGEKRNITVTFVPKDVGLCMERFVLVCDNLDVYCIEVRGEGTKVEVILIEIEDPVSSSFVGASSSHPLMTPVYNNAVSHIVFNDVTVYGQASKHITIHNVTKLPVTFSWLIEETPSWFQSDVKTIVESDDDDSKKTEENVFGIYPSHGYFQPNESKTFALTFKPTKSRVFKSQASLMVGGNENMSLDVTQLAESMSMVQLGLQGTGKPCFMSLTPQVTVFSHNLVSKKFVKKVVLRNDSQASTTFFWQLKNITSSRPGTAMISQINSRPQTSNNMIKDHNNNDINIDISPASGVLRPGEAVALDVTVIANSVGNFSEIVPCYISNGRKEFLTVQVDCKGPSVRFVNKSVCDFGLLNYGEPDCSSIQEITLINDTDIPADFRLTQGGIRTSSGFLTSRSIDNNSILKSPNTCLSFSPNMGTILPCSKQIVQVTFIPQSVQRLRTYIECHVPQAKTQYLSVRGEVQAPRLSLFPLTFNLDSDEPFKTFNKKHKLRSEIDQSLIPESMRDTQTSAISVTDKWIASEKDVSEKNKYLSKSYVNCPQRMHVIVRNMTNLAGYATWEIPKSDQYHIVVTPNEGHINGRETQNVTIDFMGLTPGQISLLLLCRIKGISQPLICKISATIHNLYVSTQILHPKHDTIPEMPHKIKDKSESMADAELEAMLPPPRSVIYTGIEGPSEALLRQQRELMKWSKKIDEYYPMIENKNMKLNFGHDCPIFGKRTMKFVLRNHTPVPTEYSLFFQKLGTDTKTEAEWLAFENQVIKEDNNTSFDKAELMNVGLVTSRVIMHKSARQPNTNKLTMVKTTAKKFNKNSSTVSRRDSMRRLHTQRLDMLETATVTRTGQLTLKKSILNSSYEEMNRYKSNTGKNILTKRVHQDIEKKCLNVGQGVVFLLSPRCGVLAPYEIIEISVTCLNDMCGQFGDFLHVNVKGVQSKHIPVSVDIVGMPINFAPSTPGLSFIPSPVLKWTVLPSRSPQNKIFDKLVTINNTGSFDLKLIWRQYEASADTDELFNISFLPNNNDNNDDNDDNDNIKMIIAPQTLPEANDNFVFSVSPRDIIVPKHGQATFTVSCNCQSNEKLGEENFEGFIQARLYIRESDVMRFHSMSDLEKNPIINISENNKNEKISKKKTIISKHNVFSEIDAFERRTNDDMYDSIDDDNNNDILNRSLSNNNNINPLNAWDLAKDDPRLNEGGDNWTFAPSNLSQSPLRLYISAYTKVPNLFIDKQKKPDGTQGLKFTVSPVTFNTQTQQLELAPSVAKKWKQTMTSVDTMPMTTTLKLDTALEDNSTILENKRRAYLGRKQKKMKYVTSKLVHVELPLPIRYVPLTNLMSTTVNFRVYCQPEDLFQVVSISSRDSINKNIEHKSNTNISLVPRGNTLVGVKFIPPLPTRSDYNKIWPLIPKTHLHGNLCVEFDNGIIQSIKIEAILLRAMLNISKSYHNYGNIHLNENISKKKDILLLKLTNPSDTDALWRIEHKPFHRRKQLSAMNPVHLKHLDNPEFDIYDHTLDDPSAFHFGFMEGVTKKGAGNMPCIGITATNSRINPLLSEQENMILPIEFHPKKDCQYRSRFEFVVTDGAKQVNIMLTLTGTGTLLEEVV